MSIPSVARSLDVVAVGQTLRRGEAGIGQEVAISSSTLAKMQQLSLFLRESTERNRLHRKEEEFEMSIQQAKVQEDAAHAEKRGLQYKKDLDDNNLALAIQNDALKKREAAEVDPTITGLIEQQEALITSQKQAILRLQQQTLELKNRLIQKKTILSGF